MTAKQWKKWEEEEEEESPLLAKQLRPVSKRPGGSLRDATKRSKARRVTFADPLSAP